MISLNTPWYVAQTKPRQERTADENLLRQGYGTYLPRLKVIKRVRRCQELRLEPMFPRYLFFRPSSVSQSIAPVRSTLGVSSIVRFGHTPAILGAETLDAIRALESTQNEVNIEKLSQILPGRRVLVVEGPFAGLEGLVSTISARRVDVLMHLLGNDTKVSIARDCLEIVE